MSAEQRPRAFRLHPGPETESEAILRSDIAIEYPPDPYERETRVNGHDGTLPPEEEAIEAVQKKTLLRRSLLSWSGLFWSALGGLVSFAIGLWVTRLIDDLFARSAGLGWVGVGLASAAGLALFVLLAREIFAIFRQRKIARLHMALAAAHLKDDSAAARKLLSELCDLYAKRPETAAARAQLESLQHDIIDGRDLIDIAERALMPALDQAAQRAIAVAAKQVSVVTAISPRAMLGVFFVAAIALRLIRQIAEIYGGRPGLLGAFKLARAVGAHLAITGGLAIGDTLMQQLIGHGIAARVSARLGEGVFNGLLTARIGLSALSVCRPMSFMALKAPGVADVAPFLLSGKSKKEKNQE